MKEIFIDLRDYAKQLNKLEPFDDHDGILQRVMNERALAGNMTNIHFMPQVNSYAGRFYLAGKVRYFAYVKPSRLGDLARFMDVVYSQLRCFRQRKKHGDLTQNQINFTVDQVTHDTAYFMEKRPDVWALLMDIRKAVATGMKTVPATNRKESNRSNMEKYQGMIADTRRMMLEEFADLRKQNDALSDLVTELTKKVDVLNERVRPLDLTPRSLLDPNQRLIPVQPFRHGEFVGDAQPPQVQTETPHTSPTC